MRPFGAWFGRFAMAGACLAGAGCGGGDIPDPDSDSRAAAPETSTRVVNRGGAAEDQAPAAPARPDAGAPAGNPSPAEAEKAAPGPAPAAPEAAPKPAEAEKSAPGLKGDASGTDEMLRIAGTSGATPPSGGETPGGSSSPAGNSNLLASGAAPDSNRRAGAPSPSPGGDSSPITPGGPPPGGGRPGAPQAPGGPPGGGRGAMAMGGPESMPPGYPGSPNAPGAPGAPGGPSGRGAMGEPGGPANPGRPGFGGGSGGGSGNDPTASMGAAAFNHPFTAVQAFMAALKAKDKDRLAEATARRAPTEAVEKHRKIFASIIDGSITDDELDEMSKALEGFQAVTQLQAKSTGRIEVIAAKTYGRGGRLQRTVVTRKEKEGWKVLDFEDLLNFKPMPTFQRRRPGR